ncbi:MAG TPA: sulfatase-like hydrolase/transferase [Acidobacteriota bacterium]|nr:sulfatase-like hydrolase/transferase [Acidobacteriota bacterium]
MTNSLDTIIGKVLEYVDTQYPDTYVIYIGDNGTWIFGQKREFIDNMYIARQDRGKGTAYESGARVGMAIRGPRIKAGSTSEAPVHAVDLFSTILEMAGLDTPKMVPNKAGDGMVALYSVSLGHTLFKDAGSLRDPINDYLLTETVDPIKNNMRHAGARVEFLPPAGSPCQRIVPGFSEEKRRQQSADKVAAGSGPGQGSDGLMGGGQGAGACCRPLATTFFSLLFLE